MASFLGPTREQVLSLVAKQAASNLRLMLGRNEPQAVVSFGRGVWRLCPLVLDQEKWDAFEAAHRSSGKPFLPEHTWQYLTAGPAILEAETVEEFVDELKKLDWPW